jgi:hypothetical protein
LEQVGRYAQDLQAVDATLRPSDTVTAEERQAQFLSLQEAWQASTDPIQQHYAKMMRSFEPGVFVGGEAADVPTDNLDLERWFKGPKGHERRIHGHRHAGVRIVRQGPTLMLALDAHVHHKEPCTVDDLTPYRVVYGIFREFSCPLFRRFQKPEISRCYGSPFWGKNEFAKKVIHYPPTGLPVYRRASKRLSNAARSCARHDPESFGRAYW